MSRVEAFKQLDRYVGDLIYRRGLDFDEVMYDVKECFKTLGITDEEYKEVFSFEEDI